MQSVSITTNVVSLNSANGEVYLIQNYVIMFVSDLLQVSGFLLVLRCLPPSIKLTTEILLKVALNTMIITMKVIDPKHNLKQKKKIVKIIHLPWK
jgi:hypothetical protein